MSDGKEIPLDEQIDVIRRVKAALFSGVPKGAFPTAYQTLSYEGDVREGSRLDAAAASLERLREQDKQLRDLSAIVNDCFDSAGKASIRDLDDMRRILAGETEGAGDAKRTF